MDRVQHEPGHEAVVDAWLARSIDHGSSVEILRLFHAALDAVWNRVVTILGPVTLTAIAERVLHNAAERYAFLSVIDRRSIADQRSSGDARWMERLYERLVTVPRTALIEGLRHGLIELLTVIGALTAEVLRGELHAALETVTAASGPRSPAAVPSRSEAAGEKART